MTTRVSPKGSGRLVAVRLSDVPLKVRQRAGELVKTDLAKTGGLTAFTFAMQIERAIRTPSDRIYYVSEEAARKVL